MRRDDRNERAEQERIRRFFNRSGIVPHRPENDPRRLEARLPLSSRGTCTLQGEFEAESIEVFDISMRGIRFSTGKPIREGERLELIVCLPGAAPRHMAVTVRWVQEQGGRHMIGAALT